MDLLSFSMGFMVCLLFVALSVNMLTRKARSVMQEANRMLDESDAALGRSIAMYDRAVVKWSKIEKHSKEAVSVLDGVEWSDMPTCSSPVVSRFCQVLNDRMGQGFRDKLQAYVPRLIGTASPEHDKDRRDYLAWSAIRVFAPIAMRNAGLHDWADRLEGLSGSFSDAILVCSEAKKAAVDAHAYDAAADVSAAKSAAYAADAGAYYDATAAFAADYAYDADAVFKVLDGLLEIGPSGGDLLPEQAARVEPLRAAMT